MKSFFRNWVIGSTLFLSSISVAMAQSSVTLYGILDIGPTYVSNQNNGSALAITSGYVQQSRFGFKGVEDLGRGYTALFVLESGFSLNNGQIANNQIFSRKSVVGIGTPYGTFTTGHDTTAYIDSMYAFNSAMLVYGPGYPSVHPGDYDRLFGIAIDNTMKFASVSLDGFSVIGSISPGGQPGSFSRNTSYSAALNYANGPLSAGVAAARAYGTNATNNGTSGYLNASASPFGATDPDDHLTNIAFGASYALSKITVFGLATQSTLARSDVKARTYEVGTNLKLTPFTVIGFDFNRTIVSHRAAMSIATASIDYYLSKGTDIYLAGAYEHVSGLNSAGTPLTAQMFIFSAASGSQQLAVHAGLRHRF